MTQHRDGIGGTDVPDKLVFDLRAWRDGTDDGNLAALLRRALKRIERLENRMHKIARAVQPHIADQGIDE